MISPDLLLLSIADRMRKKDSLLIVSPFEKSHPKNDARRRFCLIQQQLQRLTVCLCQVAIGALIPPCAPRTAQMFIACTLTGSHSRHKRRKLIRSRHWQAIGSHLP